MVRSLPTKTFCYVIRAGVGLFCVLFLSVGIAQSVYASSLHAVSSHTHLTPETVKSSSADAPVIIPLFSHGLKSGFRAVFTHKSFFTSAITSGDITLSASPENHEKHQKGSQHAHGAHARHGAGCLLSLANATNAECATDCAMTICCSAHSLLVRGHFTVPNSQYRYHSYPPHSQSAVICRQTAPLLRPPI